MPASRERVKAVGTTTGVKNTGGNRNQPIVSCLECRRMKWKCDRQFPCERCRRRGIGHLCPKGNVPPIREVRRAQASTEKLEARIKELEAELSVYRAQTSPVAASTAPPNDDQGAATVDGGEVAGGADGQLTLGDEPGSSFFFGRAGSQFLLSTDSTETGAPNAGPNVASLVNLGRKAAVHSLSDILVELPPKTLADRWTTVYFGDASLMNRIVQERCFRDVVNDAYSGTLVNSQQVSIVFVLLAIGASMDLNLPPYNDIGEQLFNAGREALVLNLAPSIGLVQAINLMSRYLANGRGGPSVTVGFWTTLGTAVRCAQSLGLHRDGEKWRLDQKEVELRRRVFWEINGEDILQSMTQARPRLISQAVIDCRFPTPKPGDSLDHFHDTKYRLCYLMGQINDLQTRISPVAYSDILQIHNSIRATSSEECLPEGISPWQRLYLRLLTQEAYMFLHQAHFARCLRDHREEPLASAFQFSYVSELEASRVMLEILRDALVLNAELACRCWIFFFHAFTAIVNFAGVAIRSPLSSLAPAALNQVEEAIAVLERLPDGTRAREDLPVLQRILQQAREAFILIDTDERRSADILGIGHKLVRRGTKSSPTASNEVSPRKLPSTFEEAAGAVAAGEGLNASPLDLADQTSLAMQEMYEWLSGEQSQVQASADEGFEAFIAGIGLAPFVDLDGMHQDVL